ncbi:MAG: transposase [Terracidiphilus sp.]|jgi:hypothetical protein
MTASEQFPIGAKVRLRGCAFGEPGTVLRIEQRKVVSRVHTNGLENFWSLVKRGISGTYVSVDPTVQVVRY